MKHTSFFSVLGAGAALFAAGLALAAAAEDTIDKRFTVAPKGKLVMNVDRGSIDVKTSDAGEVSVQVLRKVDRASPDEAAEVLKDHEVAFSQNGADVEVTAEFKKTFGLPDRVRNRLNVRYLVSVPKQYNVELKTSGGAIAVADLEGKAQAKTSGGSLRFGHIQGAVLGKTSGGGVSVEECTETVEVETSGGDVKLGEVKGNLTAKTSGGAIHIARAAGNVFARTSGGDIRVKDATGKIDASTSGGSVSATLSKQPDSDCRLTTSGGNIDVTLAENLALDLDAKTTGGRVSTDFPVAAPEKRKPTALQAKLNGGGPALILHTSGGNVNVRKM